MRHHQAKRKLGRKKNQRNALLKSLAYSLALKGKIKTTEAKAKELRPFMERLVTIGKKGTMSARREIESRVGPRAGKKIFAELSVNYKDRAGGYTRITKMVARKTDAAKMAVIEFV